MLSLLLACTTLVRPPPPEAPVAPAPPAPPPVEEPTKTSPLLEQMKQCLHWAGEEPYDDERAAMIAKGIEASCGPARAALPGALGSLSGEAAAAAVDFITHHGDVKDATIDARLCKEAAAHHRKTEQDPSRASLPYFASACPEQAKALCGEGACR